MRVMVWLQVTLLLQASVAFQVLIMLTRPERILVTSPWAVMVTLVPPAHRADAVGISKAHNVPHSTVRFEAQVMVRGTCTVRVAMTLVAEPLRLVIVSW